MSDTSDGLQQFPAGQQRTITPAADTLSATLDNAAVGTVTVTATDPEGASADVSFDVVDQATITLAVS